MIFLAAYFYVDPYCGTLIDVQYRHDNAAAVIKSRAIMKSV
jgi:hypothetical protein